MKHFACRLSVVVLVSGLIMFATASQVSLYAGERPASGQSQKHIASSEEVRAAVTAVAAVRGAQIDKIAAVFDSGAGRRQLASWGISAERVKGAVSRLDDSELASLAARIDSVMANVQGGGFFNLYTISMIILGAMLVAVVLI